MIHAATTLRGDRLVVTSVELAGKTCGKPWTKQALSPKPTLKPAWIPLANEHRPTHPTPTTQPTTQPTKQATKQSTVFFCFTQSVRLCCVARVLFVVGVLCLFCFFRGFSGRSCCSPLVRLGASRWRASAAAWRSGRRSRRRRRFCRRCEGCRVLGGRIRRDEVCGSFHSDVFLGQPRKLWFSFWLPCETSRQGGDTSGLRRPLLREKAMVVMNGAIRIV